jgi:hypothetical protein
MLSDFSQALAYELYKVCRFFLGYYSCLGMSWAPINICLIHIFQSLHLTRKTETSGPRVFRLVVSRAVLEEVGIPLLDSAGLTQRTGDTARTNSQANVALDYDVTTAHKTDM